MRLIFRIPRDTRLVEFASGWGMLLSALLIPQPYIGEQMLELSPAAGWSMFLGTLGLLHLITVYIANHAEMLRAFLGLLAGLFWVWIALLTIDEPDATQFAAFALGIGNLMAFIVHALAVHWSWNR